MQLLSGSRAFLKCLIPWILVSALGLTAAATKTPKNRELDAADWVANNRITTKFSACLAASGMSAFLSSRGPFTFFIPTDSAFAQLPPDELTALLRPENKDRLQAIVLYHVVNGKKLFAKDLLTSGPLPSCEGSPLKLKATHAGTLFVAKGKIINADIRCKNGIVNEIDTVLFPPDLDKIAPLQLAPVPPPVVSVAHPVESNWDDPPDEMAGVRPSAAPPIPNASAPPPGPTAVTTSIQPEASSSPKPGAVSSEAPVLPAVSPVVLPPATNSAPGASPAAATTSRPGGH